MENRQLLIIVRLGVPARESSDFADMLVHMYTKWLRNNGVGTEITQSDDEMETFIFNRSNDDFDLSIFANENGVHRFTRQSPYDRKLRTTTFSLVVVGNSTHNLAVVRSYVLDPYQRVVDHVTDTESDDPEGVLDGRLDDFLRRE